jgi:hypothetical protein
MRLGVNDSRRGMDGENSWRPFESMEDHLVSDLQIPGTAKARAFHLWQGDGCPWWESPRRVVSPPAAPQETNRNVLTSVCYELDCAGYGHGNFQLVHAIQARDLCGYRSSSSARERAE